VADPQNTGRQVDKSNPFISHICFLFFVVVEQVHVGGGAHPGYAFFLFLLVNIPISELQFVKFFGKNNYIS